jgi:protein ImuA
MSLALLRQQLAEVVEATRPGTPGLATGIAALDAALPNGGLPRGRLTEMVGAPGSGKTTLVHRIVARAVADGWWVAYVDATRTLAPRDWADIGRERREACGASGGVRRAADEGLWIVRPDEPARGAWCADVLLRSGAFALVVLDGAPVLARSVAVRLTRLAREADAAFLVLGDDAKASELAGSLRLRVARQALKRRGTGDVAASALQRITVVIEKGGPYQTINAGEADRGIAVARRVRTHPEVPDRRGVARQQGGTRARINTRSRRCAEPRIPGEPFITGIADQSPASSTARERLE